MKEEGSSLLSRWFWTVFTAGLLYLALCKVGEADNPGPFGATAKLDDAQFDEIGQWSANLAQVNWLHFLRKLVYAHECSVNVLRKFLSLQLIRSVRTSTTPTNARVVPLCLSPLGLHSVFSTLSQVVIICLCFMMVGRTVTWCAATQKLNSATFVAKKGVIPCAITRPEEDANTGRKRKLEYAKGVVNIIQRNVTNGLTQAVQR